MAELHSLGTVVRIGERRYVVAGHRMTRDGEHTGIGYVLVPYPLGFVESESLVLVSASQMGEVVAAGYANEAGDAYLAEFGKLAQASAGIPYEAYEHNMELLRGLAHEGLVQEGDANA